MIENNLSLSELTVKQKGKSKGEPSLVSNLNLKVKQKDLLNLFYVCRSRLLKSINDKLILY